MPKKNDVDEMRDKLARLNERTKSAEDGLKKLEDKRKKIQNLIAEEERKKRTHNLCCIGGIVYKYFGDDISPEKFKEILDYLFSIKEVREFVAMPNETHKIPSNTVPENTNNA